MSRRPLTPEDAALWQRVSATVRALPGRRTQALIPTLDAVEPRSAALGTKRLVTPPRSASPTAAATKTPTVESIALVAGLDRSWDRRLDTGTVIPDRTIDLHGHTLASAHAALDGGLDRAIRAGDRVVLLVTGRPPRRESERPHARGAIRAQVADWLALSRHAARIAAVRGAHPRHGGQGALYVILRRRR